jgi:hypothetical protein
MTRSAKATGSAPPDPERPDYNRLHRLGILLGPMYDVDAFFASFPYPAPSVAMKVSSIRRRACFPQYTYHPFLGVPPRCHRPKAARRDGATIQYALRLELE